MSRLYINLILIIIIGLTACQSNTSTATNEKHFADYYIRYLQEEGLLRAEASFHQGESLKAAKPLTFTSVFFEEGAMELRDLRNRGLRYKSERNGAYDGSFVFDCKSESGKSRKVELSMSAIENFNATPPFSKSAGAKLSWQGDPLKADEQLVVFFVDKDSKAHLFEFNGPTSDQSLILPKEKTALIPEGSGQLYLVKKRIQKQETEQEQIKSLIEFYTHTLAVELVE